MSASKSSFRDFPWLRWVLANAVGCAGGLLAVWRLAGWGIAADGVFAPCAFAAAGVLAGTLQAFVLRRIVSPWRWVGASVAGLVLGVTALGAVFGLSVGLLGEESAVGLAAASLACGAPLGVAQWLVLRRGVPGMIWWIPGSTLGMAGCVLTFVMLTRGADAALGGIAIAAAISGAAYGAVTGTILAAGWNSRVVGSSR